MSSHGASEEHAFLAVILEHLVAITQNPVWPGFRPATMPLAIAMHDTGSTWRTVAAVDTHAEAESKLEVKGSQTLMRFSGIDQRVVANSLADFDGVPTATVIFPAGAWTHRISDVADRYAGLAAHELFHLHQANAGFAPGGNEMVPRTAPWDDPEHLALARAEGRTLRLAVETRDDDLARSASRDAVALRRERAARLPQDELAYIRATELKEGAARYVEARARWDGLPDGAFWTGETSLDPRGRCYDTGLAWCLLLDRFGAGDWKERVTASDSSQVVHLDAMVKSSDDRALVDVLALWQALVPAAREDIARERTRREERLASLRSPDRARVTVRATPGLELVVAGFDPLNVLALDASTVIHERYLALAAGDASLTVLDLPAITTSNGDHPLFDGLGEVEVVGDADGGVAWPESRFRIEGDHTVTQRDDGTVAIVLGAPAWRLDRDE